MATTRIFGSECWHGNAKVVCVTTYTSPLEPKQYLYVTCTTTKFVVPKYENCACIEFRFFRKSHGVLQTCVTVDYITTVSLITAKII